MAPIDRLTTLDAAPQEWMLGDSSLFHTVAACHFHSLRNAEFWIRKLIPKNKNGEFVKWAGGRRKERTQAEFINRFVLWADRIDFQVVCLSCPEGEMSWFAWAFYMQHRQMVRQESDKKGRNCLVFRNDAGEENVKLPVLRAGYLIWYMHLIQYLVNGEGFEGKFLSDNFASDQKVPGPEKARGVAFLNSLLKNDPKKPQISLPVHNRFERLDLLSDYFCGWSNSVRNQNCPKEHAEKLDSLEKTRPDVFRNLLFIPKIRIRDEAGVDVTEKVLRAVAQGQADVS